MVLKGEGRFINRPTETGGKKYDKYFIYIPTDVAKDSSFPLKEGEKTKIKIDQKNNRLIIEQTNTPP